MNQWIADLTAAHRTFAERLADRQSMTVPAEDSTYGDLGQAFPLWPGPGRDAILQPPKPESGRLRTSLNAPPVATPTGKPATDSRPVQELAVM